MLILNIVPSVKAVKTRYFQAGIRKWKLDKMLDLKILPNVENRQHYSTLFEQDTHWEPAIAHLMKQHGLTGIPERGVRGSHIVYRVGSAWIKLMAPLFAKDMAFELAGLECAKNRISVPIPEILAQGIMEEWPYVILSHLEGERIGDVFFQLAPEDQLDLAEQIAEVTKSIHGVEANQIVAGRGDWSAFIRERLYGFEAHHKNKNLHEKWLSELPSFMAKFREEEFLSKRPIFMHADLTWDHFLVSQSGVRWNITGIIDFADCRLGHPEYEMVASIAFLFKGNRQAMRNYVTAMSISSTLDERLSEKLLAWTVLHFFSDLNTYFSRELEEVPVGDFSSLARRVYPM